MTKRFFLIGILLLVSAASAVYAGDFPSPAASSLRPLVIYYSRTGTSAAVALRMSDLLACDREEVRSKKNRFYLGTFTCVSDQLFDRDDENEPATRNLKEYNPLIIVSPVWIHKFASPMRTYLNNHSLQGKDVYVYATNQGNFTEEKDGRDITVWLASLGAQVRAVHGIMTKGKPWETLRTESESLLRQSGLLKKEPIP